MDVVDVDARDVKAKTVECLQCVWSVERLYVHRATAVRRTSRASWSELLHYMLMSAALVLASF